MKKEALVSIIINNYNYGQYLPDAINSALSQTYPNIEVIVVDDGSRDSSRDVMTAYRDRIKAVVKKNGGQASCFNKGFKASRGEIILLLDADDYLSGLAVQTVVEKFKSSTAKVHWKLQCVDQDKKPMKKVLPEDGLATGNYRDEVIRLGPLGSAGPPASPPTSGNAWSRHFLESVLPMPERPFKGGADNYLFVLAPLFGNIEKVDEVLAYYRVHGANNTSKSTYLKTYLERFEACCLALGRQLSLQGIEVDPSAWPRDHWYHKVKRATDIIREILPGKSSFILMDDDHWLSEPDFYGRKRIPFTTTDNLTYNGPPASEEAAISELERQQKAHADYIVLPWSSFWYLTAYKSLNDFLSQETQTILDNDLLKVFRFKHIL